MRNFQDIFPGLSRSWNFQEKKIQDFPGGVGTLWLSVLDLANCSIADSRRMHNEIIAICIFLIGVESGVQYGIMSRLTHYRKFRRRSYEAISYRPFQPTTWPVAYLECVKGGGPRGLGDGSPPVGSRGKALVGGLGDAQKLTLFLLLNA